MDIIELAGWIISAFATLIFLYEVLTYLHWRKKEREEYRGP